MRIAITDSGVGGLSVCAALEAELARRGLGANLELLYLNAALEDDYAYNSMPTRREQVETFDGFLDAAFSDYAPDLLFIACNTLSVMFDDPYFDHQTRDRVAGIVDTGVAEILAALEDWPDAGVAVFATPITVAGNTYRRRLESAGVAPSRIVQQACPELPDAISNDVTGEQAARLLEQFVPDALGQFEPSPTRVLAALGCTHFGYQAERFARELEHHVNAARVIDPNAASAGVIIDRALAKAPATASPGAPRVTVVSRYTIPDRPMTSLAKYLGDAAPLTLAALVNHETRPDFFARKPQDLSA
ncbi:hypothetical protein F3N42_06135 [Marinihelvus fidelis]|uniref:Uncharacterized protein n=1 Tax=Marinihelvus fidelis TaxID=2613842 RepID=A0A5N0TFY3_9GAMM|nr:aspartate/glutamate racemase family protein [Marinihelvus fidelis]KAA9132786.1 hypothetical protein F3N42_06135 [Marinihelvus fidelis]